MTMISLLFIAGSAQADSFKQYDPDDAVEYARSNYSLPYGPGGNPFSDYDDYGGNCTNFASQAIIAGFVNSDDVNDVFDARYEFDIDASSGGYQWFWRNDSDRGPAFTGAHQFYQYAVGNLPSYHGLHFEYVTNDTLTEFMDYSLIKKGDIIFADWDHNDVIDHTMIVTGKNWWRSGYNKVRLTYQGSPGVLGKTDRGLGDINEFNNYQALFYVYRPLDYNPSSQVAFNIAGSSSTNTIDCVDDGVNTTITFSGFIADGLWGVSPRGDPVYLEYSSNLDGASPYTSGKPLDVFDDTSQTHEFVIDSTADELGFFLYDPGASQQYWFNMGEWAVTGDCWYDDVNQLVYRSEITSPPPVTIGTIDCLVSGADTTITFTGPVEDGVWAGVPSGGDVYIEYGSDADGWSPYSAGKPKAYWEPGFNSRELVVNSNVNGMGFFLHDPGTNETSWFNTDLWDVTGDCWLENGIVYPETMFNDYLSVECDVTGPDVTITFLGDIEEGLWSAAPTDSTVYIEYSSDTNWTGPYTSGKPLATWDPNSDTHQLVVSSDEDAFGFFLYGPNSEQVNWFDMSQWDVANVGCELEHQQHGVLPLRSQLGRY